MNRLLLIFFLTLLVPRAQSQTVSNYMIGNCKYEGVDSRIQNRIVAKEIFSDSIKYKLGIVANCSVDSSYQLFFCWEEKSTLKISIESKNIYTSCMCYYEPELIISKPTDSNLILKLYDEELKLSTHLFKTVPINFEIYQGDTVNYVSNFGFKDGLHIYQNDTGIIVSKRLYDNGRTIWIKEYNDKGKLEEVLFVENGKILEFNKLQFKRYKKNKNPKED